MRSVQFRFLCLKIHRCSERILRCLDEKIGKYKIQNNSIDLKKKKQTIIQLLIVKYKIITITQTSEQYLVIVLRHKLNTNILDTIN